MIVLDLVDKECRRSINMADYAVKLGGVFVEIPLKVSCIAHNGKLSVSSRKVSYETPEELETPNKLPISCLI